MSEPIPVTVVGGYLGAGKTTLVNHLLRHADGLRIAVLVNDFGELSIDADLIESRDGGVIGIAGGCVCCSFGSDLVEALMQLAARTPAPEHVIVETSGVALPAAVARSAALLSGYRRDGTVVLADAETVRSRAADRYVGDTITRQLADADIVVLNKVDLVPADALDALGGWLREQAPQAQIVRTQRAQVPCEVVLGVEHLPVTNAAGAWRGGKLQSVAAVPARARFESVTYRPEQRLDIASLARALCDPALGVLRAKGRLQDSDGTWKTLHIIGSRHEVLEALAGAESAGLVCIGLAGALQRAAIDQVIAPCAGIDTGTPLQAEGVHPG